MTRAALGLILLSVTITAFAQIMLKAGMSGSAVQRAIATGLSVQSIRTVLFSPLVIGGLFLYFGAAMVWLLVLSKVDVSLAYPFVALGFGLTAVFGWLLFGEALSLTQGAAILLISAGVVLLARG
jgi:multidrug transporter EmrE-like cation transporter